jgi:glutaconate CoA-transferase, subunit A
VKALPYTQAMAEIVGLDELAGKLPSGARLGIGGAHFSRLPIALIERVLALRRRDFIFISWGGGLALELFLEAGAVKKLIFCFSSLDIFGLAPRFRRALENQEIETEEWSALAMIQALHAAHFNLPELPFQLPLGSDMMSRGDFWRKTNASFTGEPTGLARRLDVDFLLLHAQRADREGNVEIQGARGLDLSMLGASRNVLVTAEEIVEVGSLGAPRAFILPRIFTTAIARAPFGAYPTSCLPYYSTDYLRLLDYVKEEDSRRSAAAGLPGAEPPAGAPAAPRFQCDEERQRLLGRAATVKASDLESAIHLEAIGNDEGNDTCPVDELLAVCLSREYDNSSICSVGSVSPLAMVSYLLAKQTHAPGLTIIALNGGLIDIDPHPMSLSFIEPMEFHTARVFWGGDETYHWYYQQGRITHEVITVAQVDLEGRTNNVWIEAKGKRLRLPGQGGMADVANLHQNFLLYLTRHTPDRFVSSVSFCSAARGLLRASERSRAGYKPGRVRLISDLGIFDLDENEVRYRLVSIHPGVTLEQVRQQSGAQFLVADPLRITERPSPRELRILRQRVDPLGIRRLEFTPAKQRLSLIESILRAEAESLERISPERASNE